MEITISGDDKVPVLTLAGRFDRLGAQAFDAQVQELGESVCVYVLDLATPRQQEGMGDRNAGAPR